MLEDMSAQEDPQGLRLSRQLKHLLPESLSAMPIASEQGQERDKGTLGNSFPFPSPAQHLPDSSRAGQSPSVSAQREMAPWQQETHFIPSAALLDQEVLKNMKTTV